MTDLASSIDPSSMPVVTAVTRSACTMYIQYMHVCTYNILLQDIIILDYYIMIKFVYWEPYGFGCPF